MNIGEVCLVHQFYVLLYVAGTQDEGTTQDEGFKNTTGPHRQVRKARGNASTSEKLQCKPKTATMESDSDARNYESTSEDDDFKRYRPRSKRRRRRPELGLPELDREACEKTTRFMVITLSFWHRCSKD